MLENVRSLIELENGIDLQKSGIGLVINRFDAENINLSTLKKVYMRSQTHTMLNEKLQTKFLDIKIVDIPDIYFPGELKEAGL